MSIELQNCQPDLIESFLMGDLEHEQESQLTDHLEACETCRRLLESSAAEPDGWKEAGRLLKPTQFDWSPDAGPETLDHTDQANPIPLQIRNVLNSLAPSEDPKMLGQLGGYDISGVVGAGAMGVVLKASDKSLDRTVAIKVLSPHLASSGAARKRFAREAKAAAAVLHANVIAIHGVSNDQSMPHLVMPYVRGTSLQKRINDDGPLPVKEVLRIGAQVAAGLAAAHTQGLVHRDIKPANILLEEGVERVAITDFGLARAVDDASLTRTGIIAGTPQYMSPEQSRGESVDQRSDLFSLGSVMYAMCIGRPPFRSETTYGVIQRINNDHPTPIREINPDVPSWLVTIVDKLMSKQAADRYESAQEVSELLEECLAHVQQPSATPLPESLVVPSRSSGFFVGSGRRIGIVTTLIAFGFGLLGMLLWQGTDPPDITGKWYGEGWGEVELEHQSLGHYKGVYSDTFGDLPGTMEFEWSRIERRFNGTWREGKKRFGKVSLRHTDDRILGAWTTSENSEINPGRPNLADLQWTRKQPLVLAHPPAKDQPNARVFQSPQDVFKTYTQMSEQRNWNAVLECLTDDCRDELVAEDLFAITLMSKYNVESDDKKMQQNGFRSLKFLADLHKEFPDLAKMSESSQQLDESDPLRKKILSPVAEERRQARIEVIRHATKDQQKNDRLFVILSDFKATLNRDASWLAKQGQSKLEDVVVRGKEAFAIIDGGSDEGGESIAFKNTWGSWKLDRLVSNGVYDHMDELNQQYEGIMEFQKKQFEQIEAEAARSIYANVIPNTVENPLHWKWEVHIPEGQEAELCFSANEIPVDGIIDDAIANSGKRFVGKRIKQDGSFTIELAIDPQRQRDGCYECTVLLNDEVLYTGRFNTLHPNLQLDTSLSIRDGEIWETAGHPVLLHAKYVGAQAKGLGKPRTGTCHGFALWLRCHNDQVGAAEDLLDHPKAPRSVLDVDPSKPGRMILHYCDADGTPIRPLLKNVELRRALDRQGTPDVSADGKKVAFDAWSTIDSEWNTGQVVVCDIDGSNAHVVSDGFMPSFSPDGKRIAISRMPKYTKADKVKGESIWIVNTDGSMKRMIADQGAWAARWSSDGKSLVFHGGVDEKGRKVPITCLRLYDLETQKITNVFSPEDSPFKKQGFHFEWAKNKRTVAFSGIKKGEKKYVTATIDVDEGLDSLQLFEKPPIAHRLCYDFHPDGQSLLTTGYDNGRTVPFSLELAGEGVTRVLPNVPANIRVRDTCYTPDGNHIIAALAWFGSAVAPENNTSYDPAKLLQCFADLDNVKRSTEEESTGFPKAVLGSWKVTNATKGGEVSTEIIEADLTLTFGHEYYLLRSKDGDIAEKHRIEFKSDGKLVVWPNRLDSHAAPVPGRYSLSGDQLWIAMNDFSNKKTYPPDATGNNRQERVTYLTLKRLTQPLTPKLPNESDPPVGEKLDSISPKAVVKPLKFVEAEKMAKKLNDLGIFANQITFDAKTNSLILIGDVKFIADIEKIADELDQPSVSRLPHETMQQVNYSGVCVGDDDDRPIADAQVRVFLKSDSGYVLAKTVATNEQGRFSIRGSIPTELDLNACRIAISAPGRATSVMFYQAIGMTPPTIKLVAPASITGRVTDSKSDPADGATVILGQLPGVWQARTDANGKFEIADVPPAEELKWGTSNIVTAVDSKSKTHARSTIKSVPSNVKLQLNSIPGRLTQNLMNEELPVGVWVDRAQESDTKGGPGDKATSKLDIDPNIFGQRILHYCDGDGTPIQPLISDLNLRRRFDIQNTPDVSSDGNRVAFAAWSTSDRKWKHSKVIVADTDGTRARVLCDGLMPSFSPDGRQLVVSCFEKHIKSGNKKGRSIWIVDMNGGQKRMIADLGAWGGRWSSDGKSIVFSGGVDDSRKEVGENFLRLYDIQSQAITNVFNPEDSPFSKIGMYFDWDKSSRRIAFSGTLKEKNQSVIAIIDVDAGLQSLKTYENKGQISGTNYDWHPDGKSLLITGTVDNRFVPVILSLANDGGARPFRGVPDQVNSLDCCYTPDGKHAILAFRSSAKSAKAEVPFLDLLPSKLQIDTSSPDGVFETFMRLDRRKNWDELLQCMTDDCRDDLIGEYLLTLLMVLENAPNSDAGKDEASTEVVQLVDFWNQFIEEFPKTKLLVGPRPDLVSRKLKLIASDLGGSDQPKMLRARINLVRTIYGEDNDRLFAALADRLSKNLADSGMLFRWRKFHYDSKLDKLRIGKQDAEAFAVNETTQARELISFKRFQGRWLIDQVNMTSGATIFLQMSASQLLKQMREPVSSPDKALTKPSAIEPRREEPSSLQPNEDVPLESSGQNSKAVPEFYAAALKIQSGKLSMQEAFDLYRRHSEPAVIWASHPRQKDGGGVKLELIIFEDGIVIANDAGNKTAWRGGLSPDEQRALMKFIQDEQQFARIRSNPDHQNVDLEKSLLDMPFAQKLALDPSQTFHESIQVGPNEFKVQPMYSVSKSGTYTNLHPSKKFESIIRRLTRIRSITLVGGREEHKSYLDFANHGLQKRFPDARPLSLDDEFFASVSKTDKHADSWDHRWIEFHYSKPFCQVQIKHPADGEPELHNVRYRGASKSKKADDAQKGLRLYKGHSNEANAKVTANQ